MKRTIYYLAFTMLGAMIGFLVHALIEIWVIKLLVSDFGKYGLGFTWSNWFMIHSVSVILITVLFGWLGFRSGKKWWRILYVQHKYSKRWGIKLKENF
jgi:hypothetical protein